MKFLDKIVLNRLLAIITSFILGILNILSKQKQERPPKNTKRPLDWLRNRRQK